ncbi:hypothetical protein V8E51_003297 [Hyaloscypha variabilis]
MRASSISRVALTGLLTITLANPLAPRSAVCGTIFGSVAKCCSIDAVKITDADCIDPSATPKDKDDFMNICPKRKSPKCCTIPIPGLAGLFCDDPY